MKKVRVRVTRFQCEYCKHVHDNEDRAKICERDHDQMERLESLKGKTIEYMTPRGLYQGVIESVNKEEFFLFVTDDLGQRLRVRRETITRLLDE